jgi:hypothetical protein
MFSEVFWPNRSWRAVRLRGRLGSGSESMPRTSWICLIRRHRGRRWRALDQARRNLLRSSSSIPALPVATSSLTI